MKSTDKFNITLSIDEALVLFEYFERFGEIDDLSFVHPSEYLALQRIAGQVCKASAAMFSANYESQLKAARDRVAAGFEGNIAGMRVADPQRSRYRIPSRYLRSAP